MNTIDKVVVTSRSFSNNQILRKELLSIYQNVTFNDEGHKLFGSGLVDFMQGHNKAITALEKIDDELLSQLSELEVISKFGVGIDMIDMQAVRKHGIRLGWTGGVNCRSVSELVLSFAIGVLRHVPSAQREVLAGTWRQHVGGCLSGRTVGIIGCGFIGKDLVKLLQPFGCSLLAFDLLDFPEFYNKFDVKSVTLSELLSKSDIVTLHLPLDESTRDILNAEKLSLMKPGSILINTARGGLIDEKEVKAMLKEGRLAAAAFDVFSTEPPEDKELLELPNFLATPHLGGSSEEAILAMGRAAIDGLDNSIL